MVGEAVEGKTKACLVLMLRTTLRGVDVGNMHKLPLMPSPCVAGSGLCSRRLDGRCRASPFGRQALAAGHGPHA